MNHRKSQFFRCLFLLFFLFSMSVAVIAAQEPVKIPAEELQQVVDLMENPQRREVFVKDLKKVINAKEVTEKARPEKRERKLLVIESLFGKFEELSKMIMDSGASTISLLAQMPRAIQNAKTFLARSENQAKLLNIIIAIASGIITGTKVVCLSSDRTTRASWIASFCFCNNSNVLSFGAIFPPSLYFFVP